MAGTTAFPAKFSTRNVEKMATKAVVPAIIYATLKYGREGGGPCYYLRNVEKIAGKAVVPAIIYSMLKKWQGRR